MGQRLIGMQGGTADLVLLRWDEGVGEGVCRRVKKLRDLRRSIDRPIGDCSVMNER